MSAAPSPSATPRENLRKSEHARMVESPIVDLPTCERLYRSLYRIRRTEEQVASTIALAVGYAYALKVRASERLVVSFFGDGAIEEGVFHESLSFAALKKLPMLFVCENNFYAIHAPLRERQPHDDICQRARACGIPAERFDVDDVLKIYGRVRDAVASLRSGATGPLFIECRTYRWKEHVGPSEDYHLGYRTKTEAEPWIATD